MGEEKVKLLDSFESPFSWNVPATDIPHEQFLLSKIEKRENIGKEDEDNEFHWTAYILDLTLAYELNISNKEVDKALTYAESCLERLEEAVRSDCQEKLFKDNKNALLHIALTTKCHLLLAKDRKEEVELIIDRIIPMDQLTPSEKAAVLATRAEVLLVYGPPGQRKALTHARAAVTMDPAQAQWHFLLGKTLGRLRRVEDGKIKAEEVEAIEKANQLEENPAFIVHKATLYSERAAELFYNRDRTNYRHNMETSKRYAAIAVASFKKAVSLRPKNPSIMARAAHGLLRIKPMDGANMTYVKKLLDSVVEMEPNNMMYYHDLGYYYDKFENNPSKAVECLEKAISQGNNRALLYLITLKWRCGRRNQVLDDLERALEHCSVPEVQAQILVSMVVFTLLLKDNWKTALSHANRSLRLEPSGKFFVEYLSMRGGRVHLIEMMKSKLRHCTPRDAQGEYDQFVQLTSRVQPSSCRYTDFDSWKVDQMSVKNTRGR